MCATCQQPMCQRPARQIFPWDSAPRQLAQDLGLNDGTVQRLHLGLGVIGQCVERLAQMRRHAKLLPADAVMPCADSLSMLVPMS